MEDFPLAIEQTILFECVEGSVFANVLEASALLQGLEVLVFVLSPTSNPTLG